MQNSVCIHLRYIYRVATVFWTLYYITEFYKEEMLIMVGPKPFRNYLIIFNALKTYFGGGSLVV